uniref:Signal peptidase I n=1 Tax=Oryza nivara TaxID=4536 RepID=A0A0E0HNY7_ORYNI
MRLFSRVVASLVTWKKLFWSAGFECQNFRLSFKQCDALAPKQPTETPTELALFGELLAAAVSSRIRSSSKQFSFWFRF